MKSAKKISLSVTIPLLLSISSGGCNKPKPDTKSDISAKSSELPKQLDKPLKEADKPEEPIALKNEYHAEASVTSSSENMIEKFKVQVTVTEDNTASGHATIGEQSIVLKGSVVENEIKLWAVGSLSANLRSGFFIANLSENKLTGTFALSGNGGVPFIEGTWKTP